MNTQMEKVLESINAYLLDILTCLEADLKHRGIEYDLDEPE